MRAAVVHAALVSHQCPTLGSEENHEEIAGSRGNADVGHRGRSQRSYRRIQAKNEDRAITDLDERLADGFLKLEDTGSSQLGVPVAEHTIAHCLDSELQRNLMVASTISARRFPCPIESAGEVEPHFARDCVRKVDASSHGAPVRR
jgi:hypothetical protein